MDMTLVWIIEADRAAFDMRNEKCLTEEANVQTMCMMASSCSKEMLHHDKENN